MSLGRAETTARVNAVYKMILAGLRRPEIIRLCVEKHGWNVKARAIDNYIAKAKQRFEEEARVQRGAELGKAIARLDTLYAKADARKDHRGALMVERERIELLGLQEPKRNEISGPGGGPIVTRQQPADLSALTDEELAQLDSIRAKLDGDPAPD